MRPKRAGGPGRPPGAVPLQGAVRDTAQPREEGRMRVRAGEGLRVPVLPADQAAAKGPAARARLPERQDQPQKRRAGRARYGLHEGETGRQLLRRPHAPHHEE